MNGKGLLTAKQSWEKKKNKVGRLILSVFKIYYKVTVIKIAWHWQENREINETRQPRNETISIWAIHL